MNQFYFLCSKWGVGVSPPSVSPIRKLLQFFSLCNCLLIVCVNHMFVDAEGSDFISICSMVSEKKWLLKGLLRSGDLVSVFYNALFTNNCDTTLWLHKAFPFFFFLLALNMPFGWHMHLQSQGYRTAVGKVASCCMCLDLVPLHKLRASK